MSKLLDDLRSGRVEISELDGVAYQRLVFEQLVEKLFMDPLVLTVENHLHGPVDYVVHEMSGNSMLGRSRMHYFECKNYSRSLELTTLPRSCS